MTTRLSRPLKLAWLPGFLLALLSSTQVIAQTPRFIDIDQAWRLAEKNYPLTARRQLLQKTKDYTVENAAKAWLPQLAVNGQASLQSDVTNLPFKIPIAGFTLPAYSKDQYKLYGEIDQNIYDGGLIHTQKVSAEVDEQISEKDLDVQLYSLRDRVNQLYFGILLLEEQLRLNDLLQADILNGMEKTQALVDNGTAYPSAVDELRAQLLQTDQQRVEEESSRKAYLDMLGLFIGLPLDTSLMLATPPAADLADNILRPELQWYDFQKKKLRSPGCARRRPVATASQLILPGRLCPSRPQFAQQRFRMVLYRRHPSKLVARRLVYTPQRAPAFRAGSANTRRQQRDLPLQYPSVHAAG